MPELAVFPDAAFSFYEGLRADNSKAYWTAHKDVYEEAVRAPMRGLLEELAPEFGATPVLFRPHRDIRFSKDKSPYKTRGYAVGEGEGGERYYVEISATGLVVGCGYWMMAGDQLDRYRAAVDDDTTGPALVEAVAAVKAAKLDIGGEALKTAPRGYPRDHPRVELLRHKGLAGIRRFEPAAWLSTRAAARRITDVWRATAPITAWLAAHVGPSTEVPSEAGRYD